MLTVSVLERCGLADILIGGINTLQILINISCSKSLLAVVPLAKQLLAG